jgi:hypothetical protein
MKIRPFYRDFLVCSAVAMLGATAVSSLLTWGAGLPRVGWVPLAVACERANTPGTWGWVFVVVFWLGAIPVVFRETRRRAFGDARWSVSFWQACKAIWRGGRKRGRGMEKDKLHNS